MGNQEPADVNDHPDKPKPNEATNNDVGRCHQIPPTRDASDW